MKKVYPDNILEKNITSSKENHFIDPKHFPVMIRLLWTGPKSSLFEKKIGNAVRVAYYAAKVYYVYSTNRAFNPPKDKLSTPSMSNIIYLYECRRCESQYVGKTTQNLVARIKHVSRHLFRKRPTDRRPRSVVDLQNRPKTLIFLRQ